MPRVGIAHFRSNGGARPTLPLRSPNQPNHGIAPPHPLEQLLRSLRGREIAVLVAGREVEGRLIEFSPATLVSPRGKVAVIPLERISSVRY